MLSNNYITITNRLYIHYCRDNIIQLLLYYFLLANTLYSTVIVMLECEGYFFKFFALF